MTRSGEEMSRDPRLDPQPGDRLKVNGRTRRVVQRNGRQVRYVFEPGELCSIVTWMKWAERADVLPDEHDLRSKP